MKYIRTIRKALFNIIWIGITAGVLAILLGFFLVKKHEDKITEIAIEQVNMLLEAKISVENVEISSFTKIPYLSVVFRNVIIWSPNNFSRDDFEINENEKLLVAEKIYLQFNLFHVLFKKYNISRILILNGEANLLVDKEGRANYQIFKERVPSENSASETPQIQLEALRISNFDLKFNNKAKNIISEAEVKDLTLKGKFSQEEFSLASNVNMLLKTLSYDNVSYAEKYDLSIKTILAVKDKVATINKGIFSVNNNNFSTSGTIDFSSDPIVKLKAFGRGLDISSLLEMAPQKARDNFPIEVKGRADLAAHIDGSISSTQRPEISTVYLLSLDKVSNENISFSNIQLKGKLLLPNNKESGKQSFSIDKYRINDSNNKLEGSFFLTNFSNPELKLSVRGSSDLLFINNLLVGKSLQDISGLVQPDIKIETTIKSFQELNIQSILNAKLTGGLGIINTGFLINEKTRIDNLNGYLNVNENSWQGDINLVFNGSKSHVKAKADYLLNYLFEENRPLWIQADIQSELLKTDVFSPDKNASKRVSTGFFLPNNIYAKLNVDLGQFEHKKFVMNNIQTMVEIKPGELDIVNLSANSMKGKLTGNGLIQQDEKGMLLLGSKSELTSINVKELFQGFDNFGQKVINDEHINGKLSGDFEFSINADSMLNIDVSSINLNSQIELNSGELIDFEPAQKLSNYVQLKELEHIQFSTLTNTILIRDEIITIPEMEIVSSAFNINVSGTHSFRNDFDYKIKINLSELLAGKAKQSKLENEEHFVVEEDGRRSNIYLSVRGRPEDYQLKYDKKEAVLNIKKDLKEEKTTIKKILNEEFGWFNKDSVANSSSNEKKRESFILDWDEPVDSVSTKKIRRNRKNKPAEKEEVFKIEWDDGDILE